MSRASAVRPSIAVLLVLCAAALARPAAAQSLLVGYWQMLLNEDATEYGPGPDEGDFGGLPVTAAAIEAAHTWDPELISIPELQCEQLSSTYGSRDIGTMRVWEERDPYTNQQTQIEMQIEWMQMHRHIWMVPTAHPPPWAVDTWQGFSTGRWVGNALHVHTDMLKPYYIARNGVPLDDRASMEERFFVYGDVMTDVMLISDPQYLSRPVVESKEFYRIPQGAIEAYPCRENDEVPRAKGIVPMHLPGYNSQLLELGAVSHGIPLKAAQGGAQTMFPQYQDYMKALPPNPPLAQLQAAEARAAQQPSQR